MWGLEGGGVVDAKQFGEEAGAFTALDEVGAAAAVRVGVEWHSRDRARLMLRTQVAAGGCASLLVGSIYGFGGSGHTIILQESTDAVSDTP